MKRLFHWLVVKYTQRIQIRLTFYFLLLLLPLVLISLFANVKSQGILRDQTVERTQVALASSMDYIDLTLQNIEQVSKLLSTDPALIKRLDQANAGITPETVISFTEIMKQLNNVLSSDLMLSQISIYHAGTNTHLSTGYGTRRIEGEPRQEWLEQLSKSLGTGIQYKLPSDPLPGINKDTIGSLLGMDSISLVRSMDLYNRNRAPNLLVITLNKSKLLNLLRSLLPSAKAQISLYTNEGKLIADAAGAGIQGEAGDSNTVKEHTFSVRVQSKQYDWSMQLQQPEDELYGKTRVLGWFTYAIIGVSILLAILIAWFVYIGIASPVHRLSLGMKRLGSGNLNIQLANNRKDEFGVLTQEFNQLARLQKHLIEDVYEKQLGLVRTELKFLQSQINPHFLYNTLDSIYWTAKNYDAEEITEMVLNLSSFFRLSLNKGRETFTVEETVSHLNYYIRVQQLRFTGKFTVHYDIAEESNSLPLLKLLLQPLAENAILHGLEKRRKGGLLTIASRIEQGMLQLTVQDNGVGIDPERLAYIREQLSRLAASAPNQMTMLDQRVEDLYGLRNVVSRLRLCYGRSARLEIDSEVAQGTTITVTIPVDRCKDEFQLEIMKETSA